MEKTSKSPEEIIKEKEAMERSVGQVWLEGFFNHITQLFGTTIERIDKLIPEQDHKNLLLIMNLICSLIRDLVRKSPSLPFKLSE